LRWVRMKRIPGSGSKIREKRPAGTGNKKTGLNIKPVLCGEYRIRTDDLLAASQAL
jgi:hypothetical protein